MTISFRNVEVAPDAPVEHWPFEGVLAGLERGGLSIWRRLAAAIAADPWGPTARRVEEALTVSPMYGLGPVMHDVIAAARRHSDQVERDTVAAEVRRCVERSGLTQAAFARRMGTSASRLSTYMSGRVVPSATTMVRMRELAARLAGPTPP